MWKTFTRPLILKENFFEAIFKSMVKYQIYKEQRDHVYWKSIIPARYTHPFSFANLLPTPGAPCKMVLVIAPVSEQAQIKRLRLEGGQLRGPHTWQCLGLAIGCSEPSTFMYGEVTCCSILMPGTHNLIIGRIIVRVFFCMLISSRIWWVY